MSIVPHPTCLLALYRMSILDCDFVYNVTIHIRLHASVLLWYKKGPGSTWTKAFLN